MSKQGSTAEKTTAKPQAKVPTTALPAAGVTELVAEPLAGAANSQQLGARLGDPRLPAIQRQILAGQIGQMQGNRQLQQLVTIAKKAQTTAPYPILQRQEGPSEGASGAGPGVSPDPNAEPPDTDVPDDDSAFDPATLVPAGLAAEDLAALRQMYASGVSAIKAEAELMLSRGVDPTEVANWAADARNNLKQKIRDQGPGIIKLIAEARNMKKYGNPLGLTAEELRAQGKTNEQIIESAGRGNKGITKWAGRLRIAGRILILIDIGIAAYKVATAPQVDRPRVLLEEAAGVGGALAGAWAGAEIGAWAGGGIGALFGGVGAAPGAAIGGFLGGIGGAIAGAWGGRKLANFVANELYPPTQTGFEGSYQ